MLKSKNLNIILTGGHAGTTGLAVIEEIKEKIPQAAIYWIGVKSAMSGSDATSLEYKIYPSLGVNYFSTTAGKMQTKFTRYTIPLLLMFPLGFIQSVILLIKIRPRLILSFGGFSSFPVVFWGWLFGIPVILHEQTAAAGRANLASIYFARKIALSRSESLKYFPRRKSIVTGNPLSKGILSVKPKTNLANVKTILVMGGSRGSEFINEEISKIYKRLLTKYRIIHITGEKDYEKYKNLESENYLILPFVDPRKMPEYYEQADVIIGRSGANSVSEILYTKRPAILIPLPRTYMDEQYKNAKYAEEFGLAKVLKETQINPESLTYQIDQMFSNWEKIVSPLIDRQSPDIKSARNVVGLIEKYL